MSRLSHLDDKGQARMVDVSQKATTLREAAAEATVLLSQEAFRAVMEGTAPKGDVLATARIAAIMAAKRVPELIPLCHPIAIAKAAVEFEPDAARFAIRIVATVSCSGQTGVEMEALTAAAMAALTLYDMIKAVDKGTTIENVRLVAKSGGKSGSYKAPAKTGRAKNRPKPKTLMGEAMAAGARARGNEAAQEREAFRAFMTGRRLRPTLWAREAGVASGEILGYLTGRSRALPKDVAEKLARAAGARVEDLFNAQR